MHADIATKRADLAALCRRHRVARLEVFGSAARGDDFDPAHSDADFLVTFEPGAERAVDALLDLQRSMESLLGRPVDLIERPVIETSRNYIRRRRILAEAELVCG